MCTSLQPILALLGHPVAGNPTQFMMEKAFLHQELDWRYLSLDVPTEGLADALRETVASCRACRLCESRTQTVFGVGNQRAHCMIVGEAPGENEDLKGEPFVGSAGQLLDRMLLAIGLTLITLAAEPSDLGLRPAEIDDQVAVLAGVARPDQRQQLRHIRDVGPGQEFREREATCIRQEMVFAARLGAIRYGHGGNVPAVKKGTKAPVPALPISLVWQGFPAIRREDSHWQSPRGDV